MAQATLWQNETGLDLSGLVNAGDKANVLVTATQSLQGTEVSHDSLEATLEIHSIEPNDATTTPAAPVYELTLMLETRANNTSPWTPAAWTTGRLRTPGKKFILQIGPELQTQNFSIFEANDELGQRDIHPGYLQEFFRFRLVAKTNEGNLNPGMLASGEFSLAYTTFKSNA